MEKEARFRILNKTSKTVTMKIGDKTVTSTWEEFNESFVMVDKFWAVFNEEMKKKQDRIDDFLGFLTIYVMEMNAAKNSGDAGKELTAAARVGSMMEKLQEESGFTPMQIMQLVRQRLMVMNPFMVNPMFPMDKHQKSIRHKNQAEIRKESKPVPVFEEKKTTLGDLCPGLADLKKNMEENK